MTRVPLVSDSATSRQIEQRRNSVSPSFHSLLWRSNVRGVDATVKFATAAPEGVKRSSGSAVRLPTNVMVVSPAMKLSSVMSDVIVGYRRSRSCPAHLATLSACQPALTYAPTREESVDNLARFFPAQCRS